MLVDADNMSIDLIEEAKQVLKGHNLNVTVFGHPELCKAKKWDNWFESSEYLFHPVKRVGGLTDPNDEAIKKEAKRLVKLPQTQVVALLAFDKDFVQVVKLVRSFGRESVVFLPKNKTGNKRVFEEAGATVVLFGKEAETSKVRATLHSDGSGSVALADDEPEPDSLEKIGRVSDELCRLRYQLDSSCALLPAMAKFSFRNRLGSLVVCPQLSAVKSLYKVLSEPVGTGPWKPYGHDLAFVLPLSTGNRKLSTSDRLLYGNGTAKKFFLGGGPFILPQSSCLTHKVLTKLRYLDDCLNSDLNEAILLFLNATCNKYNMRKAGMIPEVGDSRDEIQEKINQALVSGQSPGKWSMAPSDLNVRQKLVAEQYLGSEKEPLEAVYLAMRVYSKRHGLPARTTYNAYIWQIHQFMVGPDPTRRDWLQPNALLK